MKTQFFAFLSFAVGVSILATTTLGSVATNKVLMVDEKGNVNEPAALATTADMAANKAALITAEEKAAAAEFAARKEEKRSERHSYQAALTGSLCLLTTRRSSLGSWPI